ARGDDERGSPRELREIGRDVRRIREAAMDAADAAGGEHADAGRARRRERAADRGGAGGSLDGRRREVPRPGLARLGAEPGELLSRQPDPNLAVEDSDRRRDGACRAHLPLRLEPDLDALAGREAVRDERRLERDDGAAGGQRVAHLVGDTDHAERSISTKRLSPPRPASWKPARRYARRARSFQLATQSLNVRGRHSRRAYSSPAAMNGCERPRPVRSG